MSKKKGSEKSASNSYNNNPFKPLKGFAVSEPEEVVPMAAVPAELAAVEPERSFADEMDFLGVDQLADRDALNREIPVEIAESSQESPQGVQTDAELFLGALGQLEARFSDQLPQETKLASPRRLKQLKQGRLTPDASLDLHGLQRQQVPEKITHFLQDAAYQGWQTLLIVTGRGLHSCDGEPVLRNEAERFLAAQGKPLVAEWGRAPRQYGGEGALVVFLKKTTAENK
jgi:DNA-nicking Smr family endonuclease